MEFQRLAGLLLFVPIVLILLAGGIAMRRAMRRDRGRAKHERRTSMAVPWCDKCKTYHQPGTEHEHSDQHHEATLWRCSRYPCGCKGNEKRRASCPHVTGELPAYIKEIRSCEHLF